MYLLIQACYSNKHIVLQTAVQDTLNEAEGSQPVFHPRQNSFEDSDEEDSIPNDHAFSQNQPSTDRNTTVTPTTTTVAQRSNQVQYAKLSVAFGAVDTVFVKLVVINYCSSCRDCALVVVNVLLGFKRAQYWETTLSHLAIFTAPTCRVRCH